MGQYPGGGDFTMVKKMAPNHAAEERPRGMFRLRARVRFAQPDRPLGHSERGEESRGRALFAAMMGLLLAGCAPAAAPRIQIRRVEVPVAQPVYCDARIPPRPALPIAALKPGSSAAENQRLMTATIALLKGSYLRLEDELRGCLKPGPQS